MIDGYGVKLFDSRVVVFGLMCIVVVGNIDVIIVVQNKVFWLVGINLKGVVVGMYVVLYDIGLGFIVIIGVQYGYVYYENLIRVLWGYLDLFKVIVVGIVDLIDIIIVSFFLGLFVVIGVVDFQFDDWGVKEQGVGIFYVGYQVLWSDFICFDYFQYCFQVVFFREVIVVQVGFDLIGWEFEESFFGYGVQFSFSQFIFFFFSGVVAVVVDSGVEYGVVICLYDIKADVFGIFVGRKFVVDVCQVGLGIVFVCIFVNGRCCIGFQEVLGVLFLLLGGGIKYIRVIWFYDKVNYIGFWAGVEGVVLGFVIISGFIKILFGIGRIEMFKGSYLGGIWVIGVQEDVANVVGFWQAEVCLGFVFIGIFVNVGVCIGRVVGIDFFCVYLDGVGFLVYCDVFNCYDYFFFK